jgi:hypothetical protein
MAPDEEHDFENAMLQTSGASIVRRIAFGKRKGSKVRTDGTLETNWTAPDPNVMTEFNLFTFNSRAFPGTAPLLARPGERVRVRIGHISQGFHNIHMHGHTFKIVATDGGDIPESAQWPETTVTIGPGQTRDYEFIAIPGDWALHCHLRHHPMNAMGHGIPHILGVSQKGLEEKIQKEIPGYMAMGETGMYEHAEHAKHMEGPDNTLPMMGGDGPFGNVGMGGMFTILKVHDDIPYFKNAEEYTKQVALPGDFGWYKNPPGTVSDIAPGYEQKMDVSGKIYVCPMHSEARQNAPGQCPKCGMNLKPELAAESKEDDSNTFKAVAPPHKH